MPKTIEVNCNLDSKNLPAGHKIYRILDTILPEDKRVKATFYWGPETFYLHNSHLYENMQIEEKIKTLQLISQNLLREAYFIEKAGIAFAAKMILLSETTQERELYSHFASQEAAHLRMIRPYLNNDEYEESDFLTMLKDLIETGDKQCLTYVIQVLLEGYGLSYYNGLAETALVTEVHDTLKNIVRDEALHYRSGVSLFDPETLMYDQKMWIQTAINRFSDHIRKGPIKVADAVKQVRGLTEEEELSLYQNINAADQVRVSLDSFNKLRRQL